jgi:SAM-dependent methyltransferase
MTEPAQLSRDRIHEYWRTPDEVNATVTYTAAIGRSLFLVDKISEIATPRAKIMEIGCNAGRNLAFLHHAGFQRLSAIEISKTAIDHMRRTYPELKRANVINAPVEDAIRAIPDDDVDILFTMAVLEHVHWDSDWIFREMKRIARRIITIEDEGTVTERHFRRNYQNVFEELGLYQVDFQPSVPDLPSSFRYRQFDRFPPAPLNPVPDFSPLRELSLWTGLPNRPLEEKIYEVLCATAKDLPAPNISARVGESLLFVRLLQRAFVHAGWAAGITEDERCIANAGDNALNWVTVIRRFKRSLDSMWSKEESSGGA